MITQKDIHNMIVDLNDESKLEIIKQFDFDVDKIKKFEDTLADVCNNSIDVISKVSTYMSTKL